MVKKRFYLESYLKYCFINNQQVNPMMNWPQCFICGSVLSNSSLKPFQLKAHQAFCNPNNINKSLEELILKRDLFLKSANNLKKYLVINDEQKIKACSLWAAYLIAKNKKSYTDGENLIRPIIDKFTNILFTDLTINKTILKIPLSNSTIENRIKIMAMDVKIITSLEVKNSLFQLFSLQFDETTDCSNNTYLIAYVRWASKLLISETILFCQKLELTSTGFDIFNLIQKNFLELGMNFLNCCSICVDGAPSMQGHKKGLKFYVLNENPNIQFFHCMLHRFVISNKKLPESFSQILEKVIIIINFIKTSPKNVRLFKKLCQDNSEKNENLLFFTNIRWLSRGTMLERFYFLRISVQKFVENTEYNEVVINLFSGKNVQILAYLSDILLKINEFNKKLQGNNNNIIIYCDILNTFNNLLKLYLNSVVKNRFNLFRNLNFYSENILIKSEILTHLKLLIFGFKRWFPHLDKLNYDYLVNPFLADINLIPDILRDEFINMINNTELRLKYYNVKIEEFWCKVSNIYPMLGEYSIRFLLPFPSTYLCEKGFSNLAFLKNKYRNKLEVENQLILATSIFEPKIDL